MVSYQKFTSIAFDVAEQKGGTFEGIEDGGAFISEVAAVWNENKQEYKQMTESQARDELNTLVEA